VVQVGMQQRSMPHIREARELLASGKIGSVNKITLSWNRNSNRFNRDKVPVDPNSVDWKAFLGTAPDQPLDGYRMRNWRWFWDFGGGIFTDLMVHWIDVAHWLTGKDNPLRALAWNPKTNSPMSLSNDKSIEKWGDLGIEGPLSDKPLTQVLIVPSHGLRSVAERFLNLKDRPKAITVEKENQLDIVDAVAAMP
jgi:predicted dehydrogenase